MRAAARWPRKSHIDGDGTIQRPYVVEEGAYDGSDPSLLVNLRPIRKVEAMREIVTVLGNRLVEGNPIVYNWY